MQSTKTVTDQSSEQVVFHAHAFSIVIFPIHLIARMCSSCDMLTRMCAKSMQLFLLTTDQNNKTQDPAQPWCVSMLGLINLVVQQLSEATCQGFRRPTGASDSLVADMPPMAAFAKAASDGGIEHDAVASLYQVTKSTVITALPCENSFTLTSKCLPYLTLLTYYEWMCLGNMLKL